MKSKEQKKKDVEDIKKLSHDYKTICVLDMHKLPCRQLQQIRKSFGKTAIIKMAKKTTIKLALTGYPNEFLNYIGNEPALVFSNETPYKLFKIIKSSISKSKAKAGDTAPEDIIISKGPTQIAPGPAMSVLQKAGLKTSVQGGKIAILFEKVIVKSGDKVAEDVVGVLSMFGIEPMKVGLNAVAMWNDKIIYERSILQMDEEYYVHELIECREQSTKLSIEIDYPTQQSISYILADAHSKCKHLSVAHNILEKDFIADILWKSSMEAKKVSE